MSSTARISLDAEVSTHAVHPVEASSQGTTDRPTDGLPQPGHGQQPWPTHLALSCVAQMNVEGLKTSTSSSVPYIRDVLHEDNLLFMLLTETWLRDQVDAEIVIDNYAIYGADRSRQKKRRGRNSGGVAAYVRDDIAVETLFVYSSGVIEALCLKLEALNLWMCVVYRQPDDPLGGHKSRSEEFSSFLERLGEELASLPTPTPNIIIAGDFNLPHASWPSGAPSRGAAPEERKMLEMLSTLSVQHFLVQVNDEPTHRAGNTLDLLFTNCPEKFTSVESIPAAPISSHNLIKYNTLITSPPQPDENRNIRSPFSEVNLFSEDTDWQSIKTGLIETNWTQELQNKTPTEMMDKIVEKCKSLALIHAPRKIVRKPKFSRIPRHRRILMRKRTRVRKSYLTQTSHRKKNAFERKLADIEGKLQESYRTQERYDEEKAINNIKANSKFFFSYARRKAKIYTPIGPLADSMGNMISNPVEMASIFSDQYESAFSDPATINLDMGTIPTQFLSFIQFTVENIINAIDEVAVNSAPVGVFL